MAAGIQADEADEDRRCWITVTNAGERVTGGRVGHRGRSTTSTMTSTLLLHFDLRQHYIHQYSKTKKAFAICSITIIITDMAMTGAHSTSIELTCPDLPPLAEPVPPDATGLASIRPDGSNQNRQISIEQFNPLLRQLTQRTGTGNAASDQRNRFQTGQQFPVAISS